MTFQRPKPLMFAQTMAFGIDHLYFAHTRHEAQKLRREKYYNPLGRETLMGFVIPDFQRGLVWTRGQQISLIESVWLSIPIGTYSVNFSINEDLRARLTNILIDGQQRLNALRAYWDDEIAYLDGHYWSELSDLDQRYFVRNQFPQLRTNSNDTAEVKRYYNALNFGGTHHEEGDRA